MQPSGAGFPILIHLWINSIPDVETHTGRVIALSDLYVPVTAIQDIRKNEHGDYVVGVNYGLRRRPVAGPGRDLHDLFIVHPESVPMIKHMIRASMLPPPEAVSSADTQLDALLTKLDALVTELQLNPTAGRMVRERIDHYTGNK